jgi:YVTN family beta-propeller protein
MSATAARAKPLVYVPNQMAASVQVIDPSTYSVIDTFPVGRSPEHVVPSHDLTSLWVNSDSGNSMTPIDPTTGRPGATIHVDDPYNLYFTPDGTEALVMAERLRRIDVRDPRTMALVRSLAVPCSGINHLDYTADLQRFVVSCEFSGKLLVVDADATAVEKVIDLNEIPTPGATSPDMARSMGGPKAGLQPGASSMPQDVRLSSDGRWLLAADMLRNGLWVINAATMTYDHFIATGLGAHGIYPSRDATRIYVTNRDEGSVSVLDGASLQPEARWKLPAGGSPDMGGVTADGRELWLSGRYHSAVYVFDTATGQVTHTIPVRAGPHGLLVWPQPGRFSLGHTGNMR